MDAFEKSFKEVNALNSAVGINVSFAKLSAAFSSSIVVPLDWLMWPSKIWPSSWNRLNQNLSASLPRTVNQTTILSPS